MSYTSLVCSYVYVHVYLQCVCDLTGECTLIGVYVYGVSFSILILGCLTIIDVKALSLL